ncbi:hypothetical protein O3M35_000214 [Rhynocoris fuscipes]|uniref:Nipped-B protein n=1 Tax=Rhynocoris fuscipes TaxID=488301 RepID=A0AAW1DS57_9HEMI
MWFTPVTEKPVLDSNALMQKVMNIINVVAISNDVSIQFIENLMMNVFKPNDDDERVTEVPRTILTACRQIVDCLVETVLRLDGTNANEKLLSCLLMLHLFAKIKPEFVVHHAITIQPYLSLKCQTQDDNQIICSIARTLEIIVPIMKHPSQIFLSTLEEDLVKLMMQQDPSVVNSCISCLSTIVNNLTRNFTLIRDCFKKYYTFLTSYKEISNTIQSTTEEMKQLQATFRRSLFIVGLLVRFFDFTNKEVISDLPDNIKNDVFNIFIYYLNNELYSKHYTLKAIGFFCIRHYELMLGTELKVFYRKYLKEDNVPILIVQVLNNLESYLQDVKRIIIEQDREWSKSSKKISLKEMGDVKAGMASTIVPYLICMSSEEDKTMSSIADINLQEINKVYPEFISMKAQYGIELSYKLQCIIKPNADIIRGFRIKTGEPLPLAINGFLYSILRTKQQRRALLLSMLKQFEEHVKTSLPKMLYLADNIAYFPYQIQDEPLFVIHHIDIILSFTGANLLQTFKDALTPVNSSDQENNNAMKNENDDEDDNENEENLLKRLPENLETLQQSQTPFQGCLLLLVLKKHLKTLYGLNDAKITQYSPSNTKKIFEKSFNKKTDIKFNPKVTLQKLKHGFPQIRFDIEARKSLVSEYLQFKTLLMNLDTDDNEDSIECNVPRIRELIAEKEQVVQESRENEGQDRKLNIVMNKGRCKKKRKTL